MTNDTLLKIATLLVLGAAAVALGLNLYQGDTFRWWRKRQARIKDGVNLDLVTIRDYKRGDVSDASLDLGILENPLFLVKKVCVDDQGRILGMCTLRLQAELQFRCVDTLTPESKVEVTAKLQPEVIQEGWAQGLDILVAYMPIAKGRTERFRCKRMREMGWKRHPENCHRWLRAASKDGL